MGISILYLIDQDSAIANTVIDKFHCSYTKPNKLLLEINSSIIQLFFCILQLSRKDQIGYKWYWTLFSIIGKPIKFSHITVILHHKSGAMGLYKYQPVGLNYEWPLYLICVGANVIIHIKSIRICIPIIQK